MPGPNFYDTRTLTANQLIDVVDQSSWIYRRLPWPAAIFLAFNHDGAAAGVLASVIIGSDTQIGPDFPVPAGGTAGVFPNQDQDYVQLLGAAGDEIKVVYRENGGVATTDVQTVIKLEPIGVM